MVDRLKDVPGWVWASGIPFGLGAWAPLVPAVRVGRRSWAAWGSLWSVLAVAGWVLAIANDGGAAGGLCIIGAWAGAIATSMSIRTDYVRMTGSDWSAAQEQARDRLAERREAVRMAAEEPDLARELGVGRPDVDGARHAGVVDVNNAPAGTLGGLPGIDDALAARIVEARAEINGFSSVADLGTVLDLDGNTVESLRDRVVFLPR